MPPPAPVPLNLPTLLEIVLSLMFIFFVVSLFVSGIWEFISTILRDKRATLLRNSLRHLLSDPAFADLIYGHPLIRGLIVRRNLRFIEKLFRRFLDREIDPITGQVVVRPAYIDPNVFARVLLGLIQQHANLPAPAPGLSAMAAPLQNNLQQLNQWVSTLPTSSLAISAEALLELQAILTALLQDADATNGGVKKALTSIENWYNAYMDRVSGHFKRYSQRGIRWVALVVVILFNIDVLHLTIRLYRDPVLRELTVGQATDVVRAVGDSLNETVARQVVAEQAVRERFQRDSLSRAGQPTDSLRRLIVRRDSSLTAISRKTRSRADSLDRQRTLLAGEALGLQQLPIGWGAFLADFNDPANRGWRQLGRVGQLLVGWGLMVAAVSFGAPFWFDVLVKLVNIRNVGKKPETDSTANT
ncbi:MAG: hypothetical protein H7Z72_22335 [Bacteroidetes bacterium]|nr:hypothetical protein [Fibrella sp.]